MKKQRRHYTPEEKVAILRRHLVEGVPVSDLCDESWLQPTVFYRWQKEFFESGAAAGALPTLRRLRNNLSCGKCAVIV
jgi:transposase